MPEEAASIPDALRALGLGEMPGPALAGPGLARVIAVHKDHYLVSRGDGDVFAEASGKFLHRATSAMDLPTVGDWVRADFLDDGTHAVIRELVPRKSLLRRKSAGRNVDYQLIGANIDTAFVLQSLDHDFNPRRLERYLVMVHESGAVPAVLLSKCDLCDPAATEEKLASIADRVLGLEVLPFSNQTGQGLDRIEARLRPGKTYCLVGSSGVGKSTLLNRLLGSDRLETQEVRAKDSKGRHTTTHRQLFRLPSGALVIDSPGMRELGNLFVETGMGETFADITKLERQCRFADCSHTNEKGCAVRAAIEEGRLPEERYRNYEAMNRESAFHEMSYHEKRRKDRAFGKMVKSVMKDKNKRR